MSSTSKPTQRVFRIKLPMRIQTSSKKKTALNLNIYRNLHHRSLHALKCKFEKEAIKLLKDIPKLGRIQLRYEVYPQRRGRLDIGNVCSVVDKFFSDVLTSEGIIEDDDYTHLDDVSFGFGGIVKKEHVLVIITEIEPRKGSPMRIFLDNNEIQKALDDYVFETLGVSGAVEVNLTSDDDGNISAEMIMGGSTHESAPTAKTKTKTKRGGRPAGSKNKPKEEEVDSNVEALDKTDGVDSGARDGDDSKVETEAGDPSKEDTKTGDRKGKNLFTDSPEVSSNTDNKDVAVQETGGGDSEEVRPSAKKSIFET